MVKSRKRRVGAYVAVAFLLWAPLLASCDSKSAEQYIRDAKADRAAGKISAAIIDVKNALQKEPKNLTARLLLAQYYLDLPDANAAESELMRAKQDGAGADITAVAMAKAQLYLGRPERARIETEVSDAPSPEPSADLMGIRGQALLALGRPDDAKAALEAGLKEDPNSLEALSGMVRYAQAKGDVAMAKERLADLQKVDPKSASVLALAGDVAFAAGDAVASEHAFEEMRSVAPWSLLPRLGLARAQIAQSKLKEAIANLDVVLQAAPNDPRGNYDRAVAAFRQQDYATAQQHLEKTLGAVKDFAPALVLAGATSYGLKQYEEANRYLSQYVYQVPQNVQARKLLATVQMALGRSGDAVQTLAPAVRQGSEDVQLLAMIGEASARSGDLASADRYFGVAVEKEPDNAALRTQLGATQVALGETDAGIDQLERAAQQNPEALRPDIVLFTTYLRSKEYDKAMEVAQRVQKVHPTDAVGFDLAGLAFLAKGDKDNGRQSLLKARELHPGDALALRLLASIAASERDLAGATQYYQEILKANAKDTSAYIGLAELEGQAGHAEQAQATLETAMQESPDSPAPRLLLGRFFLVNGKNQEALTVIEPAIAKAPKEPALLEVVGQAQLGLHNYDAAIAAFQTMIEAQPNASAPHRYLVGAYEAKGRFEDALTEAQKAVELDPKDPAAKLTLAGAYIYLKKFSEARKVADELGGLAPENATVAELQGGIATAQNRLEDAITSYKRAVALADTTRHRSQLAQALARMGQLAEAEAALLPWIKAHPEDAVARQTMGDIYLNALHLPEAQTQYAAILESNPDDFIAENNLAWLLSLQGKQEDALSHARHAASLAPNSSEVLDTLGMILTQSGKVEEAADVLRKAIAVRSDPEYQFHLAQALAGGLIIGVVPAFIGIYAYFMTETLLLTLTGFAFWASFRAARKQTLGAFALASALWVCALFTRSIALPMAALCLATLWLTQRQRVAKAAVAAAAFAIMALPAGLHARSTLGFFAPLGNLYLSQIYSASGKHDISIDARGLGGWGFGTPSFYNPTFYPFSDWTTDRRGTVAIRIDVSRGRATWIKEKQRVLAERTFPWWRQYQENLLYLLFGQSWPDNDPNSLSGLATVWTRWLWPPLMLIVACGVARRGFRGREWLLPACALGMLLSLAVQRDGIIEGRYRKPIDPVLVAAAVVLYCRRRPAPGAGDPQAASSYDESFFEYVNASARAAAERIVPLLQQQLSADSVLDVGCGQGAWLAAWQRHGVDDVFGIDGAYVDRGKLQFAPQRYCAHDLSQPFDLGRSFSVVQCLEVAEHLPASAAEALIDSLTRHGEVIVFSAAPPGQGGHQHVNERSYDYWRALFSRRDYLALDFLRPRIVSDPAIDRWYRYNTLLYVSRDRVARLSAALQASLLPQSRAVPDLAPLGHRIRKQLVRRVPVPLMTLIARIKERVMRGEARRPGAPGGA